MNLFYPISPLGVLIDERVLKSYQLSAAVKKIKETTAMVSLMPLSLSITFT
jgi:hypothetical protein